MAAVAIKTLICACLTVLICGPSVRPDHYGPGSHIHDVSAETLPVRSCRDERACSGLLTALVDFGYRECGRRLQRGSRLGSRVNPTWAPACNLRFEFACSSAILLTWCERPSRGPGPVGNRTVPPVAVMLGAATMCLRLVRAGGADEGSQACRSPEHRCRRC